MVHIPYMEISIGPQIDGACGPHGYKQDLESRKERGAGLQGTKFKDDRPLPCLFQGLQVYVGSISYPSTSWRNRPHQHKDPLRCGSDEVCTVRRFFRW